VANLGLELSWEDVRPNLDGVRTLTKARRKVLGALVLARLWKEHGGKIGIELSDDEKAELKRAQTVRAGGEQDTKFEKLNAVVLALLKAHFNDEVRQVAEPRGMIPTFIKRFYEVKLDWDEAKKTIKDTDTISQARRKLTYHISKAKSGFLMRVVFAALDAARAVKLSIDKIFAVVAALDRKTLIQSCLTREPQKTCTASIKNSRSPHVHAREFPSKRKQAAMSDARVAV